MCVDPVYYMLLYEHVLASVCVYLTQLFSAAHLSEALLSRECVRIDWMVNAAKGRLGGPYFSWEKSEGCSVYSRSPCKRRRDLALPALLLRAEPASKELKTSHSLCLIVEGEGGQRKRGSGTTGGGGIRMASHLLEPPMG